MSLLPINVIYPKYIIYEFFVYVFDKVFLGIFDWPGTSYVDQSNPNCSGHPALASLVLG